MATYCKDQDVLNHFGNGETPDGVIIESYREDAYSRINVRIRRLYTVPIPETDASTKEYMRHIESSFAAGLLWNAITISDKDDKTGDVLIKSANDRIKDILDQVVILEGASEATDISTKEVSPAMLIGSSADGDSYFGQEMNLIDDDIKEGVNDK